MKSRRDCSMRFRDKLTLSAEGGFQLLVLCTNTFAIVYSLSLSLPLPLPPSDTKTLNTRSTSHDLPAQSHDQLEELTAEMLKQLQSEQISLDQYCSSVITTAAPLLPGYLNKPLTWTAPDGEGSGVAVGHSVAAHVAVAMELLSAVVELMDTQGDIAGDKDTLTEVC